MLNDSLDGLQNHSQIMNCVALLEAGGLWRRIDLDKFFHMTKQFKCVQKLILGTLMNKELCLRLLPLLDICNDKTQIKKIIQKHNLEV